MHVRDGVRIRVGDVILLRGHLGFVRYGWVWPGQRVRRWRRAASSVQLCCRVCECCLGDCGVQRNCEHVRCVRGGICVQRKFCAA